MNHIIKFSDKEIRNEFIKSFDMNSFKQKEVASIVGLSTGYITFIINGINRQERIPVVDIECPVCGEIRKVNKYSVKNLKTLRCVKCTQDSYRTGEKYKELLVKNCTCCGKKFEVRRNTWKRGMTKCPSCRISETNKKRYGYGNTSKRRVFSNYINGAKQRGYKFDLDFDEFIEITQKKCHYCGIDPSNTKKSENDNGDFVYNGIDRVDNNKGYIQGNIVPCCSKCNQAKHALGYNEFLELAERIYNYRIKSESITETKE